MVEKLKKGEWGYASHGPGTPFSIARATAPTGTDGVTTFESRDLAHGIKDEHVARIMSAAPELLGALQELLAAYEDGTPQCHCDRGGHAAPGPCVICEARDAIAKATAR